MSIPAAVREAIASYVPPEGYVLAPKGPQHRSMIYEWGVRIAEVRDTMHFWWACLASEHCRQNNVRINMMRVKSGKTSKVTNHLNTVHSIITWKTQATIKNKETRDELIEKYRASNLYQHEPQRFVTLLETAKIVRHNLPFRSVEYEEAVIMSKLCHKDEFQPVLHTQVVMRSMLELYVAVKREIQSLIDSARMSNTSSFSLVADFWTSKCQSKKYLGLRLYMVDPNYRFRSVLLGTREFNPSYGDRNRTCTKCQAAIRECTHAKHKIRFPSRNWINNILADFCLRSSDIFGSTTDSGEDVKWMMRTGFQCQWEWCMAHMSNAASKWAFGLVDDENKSANRAMTQLQKKIVQTVYQTKSIQLLDYRSHRFLGLTRVVERILLKWEELEKWYQKRQAKAILEGTEVPAFPLLGYRTDLTQLLSLLQPVTSNNANAQAEAPTQVDVLLGLYKLRMETINPNVPLCDHRTVGVKGAEPEYYPVATLTPLVRTTRAQLCTAFHDRFFCKYTNEKVMEKYSYMFELQLFLHPDFKVLDVSLRPIVYLCNQYHRPDANDYGDMYEAIVNIIHTKLAKEMQHFVAARPDYQPPRQSPMQNNSLLQMFGSNFQHTQPHAPRRNQDPVQAEIELWLKDKTELHRDANGHGELITEYWHRQAQIKRYRLLPLVARKIFSIPSSSCQLERDYGVCGMQVTPRRVSTLSQNVDMAAFVNRNYDFLDITQCSVISEDERSLHIPSNVCVNLDPYVFDGIPTDTAPQVFSNPIGEGEKEQS